MLFRRREPATLLEQARVLLWPRRSWERSFKYIVHRLMRVRETPHQLALGCAIGVFAALTPLVGLQMVLAGFVAIALRASFAAAMLGTFFGNPITWALFWPLTYWIGCLMLGVPAGLGDIHLRGELQALGTAIGNFSPSAIIAAGALVWPFFKPMLVGTIPVGLAVSWGFYVMCKRAAIAHRARRSPLSPFGVDYPLGGLLAEYDPAR